MGWLRLVAFLKLYVSLENIGLFYRALLQKRPMILRSLLAEATPYPDIFRTHISIVSTEVTPENSLPALPTPGHG